MERRLAAIMATDVVGYSRLIRADEEGTIAALKALRADLIDPKIAEHHGRIVKLMGDGMLASYGANCIYCTDSAGYMLPDDVKARIGLLRSELSSETEIGFHGHHNLGMSIANSLAAMEMGASRIDGASSPISNRMSFLPD